MLLRMFSVAMGTGSVATQPADGKMKLLVHFSDYGKNPPIVFPSEDRVNNALYVYYIIFDIHSLYTYSS